MKILQIHNKYIEKGGEDTVVANERQLLCSYGHEVQLCEFDNLTLQNTSKIQLFFKTVFNTTSYRKVKSHIDTFKPDVIHVHNVFYDASPSVFWAIKRSQTPAVMTIHQYRMGCVQGLLFRDNAVCRVCLDKKNAFYGIKNRCFQGSWLKSLQLTIVNICHQWTFKYLKPIKKFIFLADFTKNILAPVLYVTDTFHTEGVVKPNFVSDFGFSPMSSREDFYLFVGRLNEQKGLKVLIDIFTNNKKKLKIIGSGPLENYVKTIASRHENIQYLGYADTDFIINNLKKCKSLIVPSLTYEGQPMTILEAFSTGTPVIATNIKNLDSMIEPGYNGFLFNPLIDTDFFETLDDFYRPELYMNARATYERHYSTQQNYEQLMTIYTSLKNTKPTPQYHTTQSRNLIHSNYEQNQ